MEYVKQFDIEGGKSEGGIVPGRSYSGDNVLARVISGEFILNRSQQANLYKMIKGGLTQSDAFSPHNLRFEIEGNKLVAILNQQYMKKQRI